MKRFLLFLLAWVLLPMGASAEAPVFGVSFDPTAVYFRIGKGTTHGLKNDYLGPQATKGNLVDATGAEIGTWITAHADDFETIAKVTSLAEGKSLNDVDHLVIPDLQMNYLKFTREDSAAYFR